MPKRDKGKGSSGGGEGESGQKVLTPKNSLSQTKPRDKRPSSARGIEYFYVKGRQQKPPAVTVESSPILTPSTSAAATTDEEVASIIGLIGQQSKNGVEEVNLMSPSPSPEIVYQSGPAGAAGGIMDLGHLSLYKQEGLSSDEETEEEILIDDDMGENTLPVEPLPEKRYNPYGWCYYESDSDDGAPANNKKNNQDLSGDEDEDRNMVTAIIRKRKSSTSEKPERQDEPTPVVMKKSRLSDPPQDADDTSNELPPPEDNLKEEEGNNEDIPKVVKRRPKKPPGLPVPRPVRNRKTVLPVVAVAVDVVKQLPNGVGKGKRGRPVVKKAPNATTVSSTEPKKNPRKTKPKAARAMAPSPPPPEPLVTDNFFWEKSTLANLLEYGQGYRLSVLPAMPESIEQVVADGLKHFQDKPSTSQAATAGKSKRNLADLDSYYINGSRTTAEGKTEYQVVWKGKDGQETSEDESTDDEDCIEFEDYDFGDYFFDKMPVKGASDTESESDKSEEDDDEKQPKPA